jgi:hypothetical protein
MRARPSYSSVWEHITAGILLRKEGWQWIADRMDFVGANGR